MRNFAFLKLRQKMSGFPMKSVFMFQIKGGKKREGGYYNKTASNHVKMKVFAYGV